MAKVILSVRVAPAVHAQFERVAAVGGMTTTEALKSALELYLRVDDADRLKADRASALQLLAKAAADLRFFRRLVDGSRDQGPPMDLQEGALEAAIKAVENAAERLAP